jgi:CRP-like cAMP-binding protein
MTKSKAVCNLKTCFLCRHCEQEWLPAIDANRRNFHFKKGELIFNEGAPMEGMFFVIEGTVKVHKKWGDEKELIVRFAKKGDIMGHRGLGKDNIYSVSATSIDPVTVCFIDLAFFQATLKVNPGFLYQLMMFFAEELKISEKKMRDMAHMQVKGRIAQALLTISEKFGEDELGNIDMTLSRQNLASFTGTTYETAFRIMNEFEEEKIINVSGKSISLTNKLKLIEFVKENNS